MKIALLSGSISNNFAATIILKLKQQRNNVSIVIVKKRYVIKNIKRMIRKYGLKDAITKGLNKFVPGKFYKKDNQPSYLRNYLENLGYNPAIRLKDVIKNNNIPCISVHDIADDKSLSHLRSIKPDIIIYTGGGIIRKGLLKVPKIGILNAHMGLLPKYRGMNVLEWSLFNNAPIGITVHFIDKGIDTGDILLRKAIPIKRGDTIENLRSKSQPLSVDALAEVVNKLRNGAIQPIKQKDEDGKQYFVMHKRLKDLVAEKLQELPANKD